jgi:hypothetical protein
MISGGAPVEIAMCRSLLGRFCKRSDDTAPLMPMYVILLGISSSPVRMMPLSLLLWNILFPRTSILMLFSSL